jgi:uncharacterized membrane protein
LASYYPLIFGRRLDGPHQTWQAAVGAKMKNENIKWSMVSSITAFLIGAILLWSFGKNWLNFESVMVFLAGLIGVAIPVFIFAAWKIYQRSDKDDE